MRQLQIQQELRKLVDDYASLGDDRKISEVMDLFTSDLKYSVYMGGNLISSVSGREAMEKDFKGHAAEVKTYFTLNGQHTVKIEDNSATGVSFTQIKMIREAEGRDVLTDYSVRYEDYYVEEHGRWLIKDRVAHFLIIETRSL